MNANRQKWYAVSLLSLLLACLAALVGRLVQINTELRPNLLALAARQQQSKSVIPARRGRILDSRYRIVSATQCLPDVFVDPSRLDDPLELAKRLGARINVPVETVLAIITRRPDSRYAVVATGVDDVTADAVRSLRHGAVGLTERATRVYPLGESMSHVLGFVGRDGHGLEGMELAFDEHLRGVNGRLGSIRDARRRALWRSDGEHVAPIDGGDIVLTIDAEIQRITEEALKRQIDKFEAQSGVAIVMDPTTGDVLAMASWPAFDPAEAGSASADVRRNRAITDPVEPGSTFKPFIACGALDAGTITATTRIDCQMGEYRIGNRVITDTKRQGILDLTGIITHSSNIGMAIIGNRMGNELLHSTIKRFGFGELTGSGFPGESSGIVYALNKWNSFSTTSVSFGYEICVTPLQLLTAFSSLLNDGVLLRPRIVRERLGPDGRLVEAYESAVQVRQAVSVETARYMERVALVSVVRNGSCGRRLTGPYSILGKTGTAKLLRSDRRGYETDAYLSTFLGGAPTTDPQVAAVMMIRRPNARIGYYGGTVSAPGVGDILTNTLKYLGAAPDRPDGELAMNTN